MPRPDLGLAFAPLAPIDPPPPRAPGSRPPGVPGPRAVNAASPDTGVRDARRRPRRIPQPRSRPRPISMVALEPRLPLDLDDFQELRRLGLFGDDGRSPPPSWWAR